ncbi:hypothetical protein GCM10010329_50090 [Streptomyces spiroverticillatus]|uniref:Uncharacterized protein n=1 Tax=Streptomyces finlayi TaxID=67296 RepID=A0A919CBT4_9ACTN|nr:hypothetical protein GCM10010329_50090 [Streptomyces spiroverticillatus]GHD03365.1 hypothetical protein GCM10010334_51040 [Streptomyces finlayi]
MAKVKAITAPWATCDFYNVRDCQAVIPKGLAVAVGETVLVLVGRAANVVLCVLETKS